MTSKAWVLIPTVVATLALLISGAVVPIGTAPSEGPSAAGGQASSNVVWHIEASANCNNRELCLGEQFLGQPVTRGGIWGQMDLTPTGGRAEFTACNESTSPGPNPGGTIHVSVQISAWKVGPAGTFLILSGSETVRGGTLAGSVLPIIGPVDTGIRAAAGHYTTLVGASLVSAPGVRVEVQVVELSEG